MSGQSGKDRMTGGTGADRFRGGPGRDIATDVRPGGRDRESSVP